MKLYTELELKIGQIVQLVELSPEDAYKDEIKRLQKVVFKLEPDITFTCIKKPKGDRITSKRKSDYYFYTGAKFKIVK